MPPWVTRAFGMAVLHAAATVALAKIVVFQPTDATFARVIVLALLVGAAALWGALDGWLEKPDSGRTWFIASLVAAVISAVLGVIGRSVFVDQTGLNQLGSALTGGAAFTALVVLVPAGLGLFVGGRLAARDRPAENDEDDEDSEDSEDSEDDSARREAPAAARTPAGRKPSPRRRPSPWRRDKKERTERTHQLQDAPRSEEPGRSQRPERPHPRVGPTG